MTKYKKGYTTGVFDLFHIGHLNILRRAKEQCECLIVGVSTDELVQSYKNKMPTIPFEQRKAIVEAIRYVDKVVPQTSMDKMNAWNEIRFDVMFHGDEWKGTDLYNKYETEFAKKGVDVKYLSHTKGISSTSITKKLHNKT
jgi:glycerol-3-phosphate cytidylyltransferase